MFNHLSQKEYLKPQHQPWLERRTVDYVSTLINLHPKSVKSFAVLSQFKFGDKKETIRIYPDSCPKMVFSMDPKDTKAFLIGPRDSVGVLDMETDKEIMVVSMYSFYGTKNWKINTSDAFNQIIELKDVLCEIPQLQENLYGATSFDKRARIFKKFYRENMTDFNYDVGIAESTALYLNSHFASVKMDDLVDVIGYSRRHIENKFKEINGVSLKKYSNIFRFQRALGLLYEGNLTNADIAQKTGYFDESHLIKDFNTYTGLSPSKFISIY